MVTKKRAGREGVQPDIGQYLAIERPRQHAFSSHPQGMIFQAPCVVEALDRGHRARSSRLSSHGIPEDHVAILISSGFAP